MDSLIFLLVVNSRTVNRSFIVFFFRKNKLKRPLYYRIPLWNFIYFNVGLVYIYNHLGWFKSEFSKLRHDGKIIRKD